MNDQQEIERLRAALSEIRNVCANSPHTRTNGDLMYIEEVVSKAFGPTNNYNDPNYYPPADFNFEATATTVKHYNPIEHYQSLYGFNVDTAKRTYLLDFIKKHPPALVEYALNKARESMVDKPINYASKLLIIWKEKGFTTIEMVKVDGKAFEQSKGGKENGINQERYDAYGTYSESAKSQLNRNLERLKQSRGEVVNNG